MKLNSNPNKKGAIALTAVLVLAAVILVIVTAVALLGISSRLNSFNRLQSERAFIQTDACAEEALLQLSRDASYSGGSYTIGSLSCLVVVSDFAGNKRLRIEGVDENFTRDIIVDVQLAPTFGIINFND